MLCNKTRTPTIPVNRKILAKVSPDKTIPVSRKTPARTIRTGPAKDSPARISPVKASPDNLVSPGRPNQVRASHVSDVSDKGKRMDKDRIKGAGHEVKGGIKETAGKVTGNKSTELEGKVEKSVGTAQRKVGEAKDDILDRPNE